MRSMNRRLHVLFLLLLGLALVVPAAWAEDEVEPSPADRYLAASAALPAPAAKHGFSYAGEVIMGGNPIGKMAFMAKPTDDGKGWNVTESMSLMGGAFERKAVATVDARLAPLKGTVEGKEPGAEGFKITWEKTKSGFMFVQSTTTDGETEVTEKVITHEGQTQHTFAALFLFIRMSPPGKATFAATAFEPDPDESDPVFETATWTQDADGMHEGRPVLVVEGKKGDDKLLRAWFEPADRSLIGFVMKKPSDGMSMEFKVTKGDVETKPDPLKGPAKTPETAAMQAALAFATADPDLIERSLHWPTLYDEAKVQHALATAGNPEAEPFPDLETYKAAVQQQIKQGVAERQGQMPPRPMLEAGIKMVESQLQTEKTEDGYTKVTFPDMFMGLQFFVGEYDGVWKVVRMPKQGG